MTLVLQWTVPAAPAELVWVGPDDAMLDAVAANPATPIAAIIGPQGAAGDAGGGINWVDGEAPAGVKNGVNPDFTLAHAPSWLVLVWNGQVMVEGVDFTLTGAAIHFLYPGPAADAVFAAFYTWE